MMALQAGVLVALTQQIPEHQVLLFGALGVRVKVCSLVCAVSLQCLSILHPTAFTYDLCDFLDSHVHLGLPIALYFDSVWLARLLGIPPVLEEDGRRYYWTRTCNVG